MDKPTAVATLIVIAVIIVALTLVAYRHEARTEAQEANEPTELDQLLVPAEDRDWTREALAVVRNPGDPLERELSDIELADALLFEEIAAAHPVRLDWRPPSFTQEWSTLGAVLAEMGETQPLPRIEVAA